MSKPYEQYRIERAAQLQDEADEAAARKRSNDETRRQYLAGLEAQRAEERRASAEAWEEAHAAERNRLQREWLVAHPDRSAEDFITRAWPKLKENILERERLEYIEATKAKMLIQYGGCF
jgi:hypothetical protein